jgi:hypothetical protein
MNSGSVALGAGEENPKTFMVVGASLSVIVVAGYVFCGVGRLVENPTYGTYQPDKPLNPGSGSRARARISARPLLYTFRYTPVGTP